MTMIRTNVSLMATPTEDEHVINKKFVDDKTTDIIDEHSTDEQWPTAKAVFQSVSNLKETIASAITDKGVTTSKTDTVEQMASNIRSIAAGVGGFVSKSTNEKISKGWKSISTLPYEFYNGCAVVYKNEIHVMGSYNSECTTKHYKYNGISWVEVSTLPYEFYNGCAVVWNDKIHIMGSIGNSENYKKHYKYDGTSWVEVSTLPYDFYYGCAVVYRDEIHIMGCSNKSHQKKHYKYNGTSWESVSTLPYSFYQGCAVVWNDEIHIMGSTNMYATDTCHYKYNGTSWVRVSTLPFSLCYGNAVVYRDEIHIMGSYTYGAGTDHYKYNGTSWTEISTLPYALYQGYAVVWNNEIHILGTNESGQRTNHYSFLPDNENITVILPTDAKIYTDGIVTSTDGTFVTDDTNLYTVTSGYVNFNISKATYLTCVKNNGIVYESNTKGMVYLLSGMKLNGTPITQNGFYYADEWYVIE